MWITCLQVLELKLPKFYPQVAHKLEHTALNQLYTGKILVTN